MLKARDSQQRKAQFAWIPRLVPALQRATTRHAEVAALCEAVNALLPGGCPENTSSLEPPQVVAKVVRLAHVQRVANVMSLLLLRLLLAAGLSPDGVDILGRTPLHVATLQGVTPHYIALIQFAPFTFGCPSWRFVVRVPFVRQPAGSQFAAASLARPCTRPRSPQYARA